jgi:hypothetical protein
LFSVRKLVEDDCVKSYGRSAAMNKLTKDVTVVDATDAKVAKETRRLLFKEEAERAMKALVEKGIAVRENMMRLRGLRLAREEDTASRPETGNQTKIATGGKRRLRRRA